MPVGLRSAAGAYTGTHTVRRSTTSRPELDHHGRAGAGNRRAWRVIGSAGAAPGWPSRARATLPATTQSLSPCLSSGASPLDRCARRALVDGARRVGLGPPRGGMCFSPPHPNPTSRFRALARGARSRPRAARTSSRLDRIRVPASAPICARQPSAPALARSPVRRAPSVGPPLDRSDPLTRPSVVSVAPRSSVSRSVHITACNIKKLDTKFYNIERPAAG